MTGPLHWPNHATPEALAATEAVPLEARSLPESTYALPTQAARPTAAADAPRPLSTIDGVRVGHLGERPGSIVAAVTIHPAAQEDSVKATLGRHAIEWRLDTL
ncbi:hypothetical protein [Micromonospora palythoicola]|uniref:hypothetical protein n=1 Tax=Micromonospora palythoicola TaxID=3120507 RepID=UPI002FCE5B4B